MDAGAVDFHGEDLAAGGRYRGFYPFAGIWLDQQDYAASPACAAPKGGPGPRW